MSSLHEDMEALLEKKKMVFGKLVDVGKKKFKAKARSKRVRMRGRTNPNKVIGKGFARETIRQIDHAASRGAKKKRGSKTESSLREAMETLLGTDS